MLKTDVFSFKKTLHQRGTEHVVLQCYLLVYHSPQKLVLSRGVTISDNMVYSELSAVIIPLVDIYALRIYSILSGIFISEFFFTFGLHVFNSYCVQPACAFYSSVPSCSPFHSSRSSSSGPRVPSGGPCTDHS